MEGDAEAVGFVADLLQNLKCPGVAVDEERVRIPHPHDFLQPFCKAHNCEPIREPQLGQGLPGCVQLPAAAVDHYQIWQIGRGFRQHAGIPPVHHFLHGREIVGAKNGFYLELPVILLGRLRIAENHTGSHGVRALYVGVVEALDMMGQAVQRQRLLQLLHHGKPPRIRVCMLFLLDEIEVELLCIFGAQLQQGQLIPARGHRKRNAIQ